jgi:hypothetical protein
MAQFSTGLGLAVLGGCILGAAAISSHRLGGEAFAQGTGGERRIVSASVLTNGGTLIACRIWSDNAIDLRPLGNLQLTSAQCYTNGGYGDVRNFYRLQTPDAIPANTSCPFSGAGSVLDGSWFTIDNGTSGFRPLTDVDMSGETDAGDISQVLLDFNTRSDDLPPPPIDCNINAPR